MKGLLLHVMTFFLDGGMFMEDCNKGILKIEDINCFVSVKMLIKVFLKNFYIERVVIQI